MKLASIQKVTSVEPIEGADKIVKIIVAGHELVTQKSNNLKINDFVVYFEVDAMLPTDSTFGWLAPNLIKSTDGYEGYRITPRKTKGIISDGLCLPLSYFEQESMGKIIYSFNNNADEMYIKFYNTGNSYFVRENEDLTKEINIKKFN